MLPIEVVELACLSGDTRAVLRVRSWANENDVPDIHNKVFRA
jgi:hypothetical protein